jgi:signal transduction histidine kinase
LKELWGEIRAKIIKKRNVINIVAIYIIALGAGALVFYRLIPVILNYPPDIFTVKYDVKYSGFSYTQHTVIFFALALLFGTVALLRALRGIEKWRDFFVAGDQESYLQIQPIRKKCLNLPYVIYIIQISVLLIIYNVTVLFFTVGAGATIPYSIIVGHNILILAFGTLTGIISLIFSKRVFEKILYQTYHGETQEGIRIGLKPKIFLQILPLIIVSILLTSLMSYSRLVEEKGDLLFKVYQARLRNKFSNDGGIINRNQVQKILSGIKLENKEDTYFIMTPQGRSFTGNGIPVSPFFIFYLKNFSPLYNGRVYSDTGYTQGAVIKIKGEGGDWVVGVQYQVSSYQIITFFLVNLISLLILNIVVLYYFSKSISGDISLVAKNLTEIAKGETVNLDMKLPVTSNDEMADLIIAFNKIQELEKANLKDIKEKQAMLVEGERLASLGQLIGGIAHNLRTPIMSISGGIEAVKELVQEYHDSIEDETVTKEDLYEICDETLSWLEAMKPYCAYMSDIITTVREQAIPLNVFSANSFSLDELVKRVELLMKYELTKNQCTLKADLAADISLSIQGELSQLVQVFTNLIVNAIQSYEGKGGEIEFRIVKEEKNILFMIQDHGAGIPSEIQMRLFKEMVTTKGKKGSGLGLYLSHSNIKGRFGGEMWFESTEGKGSIFYISLPIAQKRLNEGVSS